MVILNSLCCINTILCQTNIHLTSFAITDEFIDEFINCFGKVKSLVDAEMSKKDDKLDKVLKTIIERYCSSYPFYEKEFQEDFTREKNKQI